MSSEDGVHKIQNNGTFIKYIYVRILYVYEGQTWMCSIFMICIFILNYAEGAGITQLVEVHILYILKECFFFSQPYSFIIIITCQTYRILIL